MPISTHDIRQALLANDPEFRRLAEEHSRCESQLEEIVKQSYMNSEVLLQEITLKKMKLRLKDQMELIVARHQHQMAHT
ncbi:MAG TPA: YdcH family protein [Candidatus Acidoferrales bacterium]|nr:YdcH family protein [Candidatus Acidoferrales bacterium]